MAGRRQRDDDDDGPVASTSSLAAISQPVVVYKAKRQRQSVHLDDADEHLAPICAFPALSPYEAAHSDAPRRLRRRAYIHASKALNKLCEEALDDVAAPTVERLQGWLEDAARAATTRGTKTIPLAAVQSLLPQADLYQRAVARCSRGAGKGKAATTINTAWAHLSLAHCQASSAARLIEVIVEQWLAQVGQGKNDTTASGGGASSAWRTLQQRHRLLPTSSRPRSYVLSLAGLPQAPLFSTLAYLANLPLASDDDNAPQLNVAIVLQCCQGPAGLDGVPWEDKRGLDVDVLQMGGGWDARKLISRIASTPGLGTRQAGHGGALSPAMLRAAYQRAKESPSSPSAAIEAVRGWLDLALQRHFTTSLRSLGSPLVSASSSNSPALSASDFTPAFFTQLRSSLVRSLSTPASDSSGSSDDEEDRMDVDVKPTNRRRRGQGGNEEPNLSCLPQWLREDKQKLRSIMKGEDEATLLQLWLASLAGQDAGDESGGKQGQQQRGGQSQQELGLDLLALGMPQGSASISASAADKRDLDALRYSLATSAAPSSLYEDDEDDDDDAATRAAAQLRRKVNNILAPRLKALRRPATEETAASPSTTGAGADPLSALESWLDRIEDWADAPSDGGNEDASEPTKSTSSTIKSDLLLRIRALQQELAACLADSSATAATPTPSSSRSAAPRSPDVAAVSRRLLREERIRTLRSSIADWYGSTTRRLLLSSSASSSHPSRRPLFSNLFPDTASGGLEGVATLESIAADGACPRAAITLGLARPGVYLEHFAATEETMLRERGEQGDAAEGERRERLSKLKGMLGQKSQQEPRTPSSKKRKRGGRAADQEEDDDEQPSSSSANEAQTDLSIAYSLLLEAGGPGGGTRGRLVNLDDWYRAWLAVRGSPPAATAAANKGKANHEGEAEADPQARFALALSTLALLGYVKKTTRGAGGGGRTKAEGKGSGQSQRGAPGVRVAKVGGWDRVLGFREEEEGLGVADGEEEEE